MYIISLSCYSIQGDERHAYRGDRTKDEIVGFGLRMSVPPVQHLDSRQDLRDVVSRDRLFFLYVGTQEGSLWVRTFALPVYIQFEMVSHVNCTFLLVKPDVILLRGRFFISRL